MSRLSKASVTGDKYISASNERSRNEFGDDERFGSVDGMCVELSRALIEIWPVLVKVKLGPCSFQTIIGGLGKKAQTLPLGSIAFSEHLAWSWQGRAPKSHLLLLRYLTLDSFALDAAVMFVDSAAPAN